MDITELNIDASVLALEGLLINLASMDSISASTVIKTLHNFPRELLIVHEEQLARLLTVNSLEVYQSTCTLLINIKGSTPRLLSTLKANLETLDFRRMRTTENTLNALEDGWREDLTLPGLFAHMFASDPRRRMRAVKEIHAYISGQEDNKSEYYKLLIYLWFFDSHLQVRRRASSALAELKHSAKYVMLPMEYFPHHFFKGLNIIESKEFCFKLDSRIEELRPYISQKILDSYTCCRSQADIAAV